MPSFSCLTGADSGDGGERGRGCWGLLSVALVLAEGAEGKSGQEYALAWALSGRGLLIGQRGEGLKK